MRKPLVTHPVGICLLWAKHLSEQEGAAPRETLVVGALCAHLRREESGKGERQAGREVFWRLVRTGGVLEVGQLDQGLRVHCMTGTKASWAMKPVPESQGRSVQSLVGPEAEGSPAWGRGQDRGAQARRWGVSWMPPCFPKSLGSPWQDPLITSLFRRWRLLGPVLCAS